MYQYALIPARRKFALFTFLLGLTCPLAAAPVAAAGARVSESYGKLPLHFEANQGQAHKDVRFLSRGSGYSLYLTAGEAVLALTGPSPATVRMRLVGAAPRPLVSGLEEQPGKANYFIGKDPAQWRTNVPTYAKVHYRGVYPGIDLVYYGNQRQLEYDFVVAPGADPKKIVLSFKGAEKLEIDAQGDLLLRTAGGDIRQHKPIIYQEIDGVRRDIEGGYIRKGAKRVGFQVAAYDASRPLVIDPILVYSTYLGGKDSYSSWTAGSGIAVDAAGNAYVTGTTNSQQFPTTAGAFDRTFRYPCWPDCDDAFVTKLDPTGSALVYSTYLGGSSSDRGVAIAVDAAGSAYVTGTASADFPTTPGAFRPAGSGGFVTKLDPTGSALVYSTYLGGGTYDSSGGIAVDADGNAYVTGKTTGSVPTTAGAFQTISGGSWDAFVTKLNRAGSALVYSTYLGGSGSDIVSGIALDSDRNAYITGYTNSTDFPTTAAAFQPSINGGLCRAGWYGEYVVPCFDAFVAKLDATGSALIYSTYLGGTLSDSSTGIAVDASGNAYVAGVTNSTNFPTTAGAFQPSIDDEQRCFDTYTGGYVPCTSNNVFVTKLDPTGSALAYSTYLGGWYSRVQGIAVGAAGNAYVIGWANYAFPKTPGTRGDSGGFVTKLDPAGSALVYTFFSEECSAIAVDAAGNAYVTGGTSSAYFPTTPGAFQTTWDALNGSGWAFVAKIAHNRSEESAATYGGYWPTYGPETGKYSGDTMAASDVAGSTATFSFTGTAVSWIGVKCVSCGIATVSIDGGPAITVNTAGPGGGNSLTSEPVFSYYGLAPDVSHTLTITVTGTTTSDGTRVAVDAFETAQNRISEETAARSEQTTTTRSEESAATGTGSWTRYGAETGTFSGGTVNASDVTASTAMFSFTGTAVSWIGVKCNVCGIASVSIDGGAATTVDTAGPGWPGSLTSEPVFAASGLAPDVSHTLTITVTGTTTSGGAHVAVDAFDLTK